MVGSNSGHVRVYQWWFSRGRDIDGEAASISGTSVALNSDGTVMVVQNNDVGQIGHVQYITGGSWCN